VKNPPLANNGNQPAFTPEDQYIALVRAEIRADTAYFSRQIRRYRLVRVVAILAAASVPVLATISTVPRWVLGLFGAIAAITEGIQGLFQFRRSALNAMKKCNELERVLNQYLTAIGPYRESATAFATFASHVEMIRKAADEAFLQTWQVTTPSLPSTEDQAATSPSRRPEIGAN
jgi:Protein of unknown function (DUF4231)